MLEWFSYPWIMFLNMLESSNELLGFSVVLGEKPDEFSTMLI